MNLRFTPSAPADGLIPITWFRLCMAGMGGGARTIAITALFLILMIISTPAIHPSAADEDDIPLGVVTRPVGRAIVVNYFLFNDETCVATQAFDRVESLLWHCV